MTYILFDLDGTLTDPKTGITRSVQYALEKYGIRIENTDELCPFIGPPLKESFIKFFGFDEEMASDAVAKYREYFATIGIYENVIYDGVPEMLETLKNKNRDIILATSKPTVYAKKILEYFEIDKYFRFISGSELDGRRTNKAEVINYALRNCQIDDLSSVVMVGDRKHDILGAKQAGVLSVGVLYGYGSYEELANASPDKLVSSIGELTATLL